MAHLSFDFLSATTQRIIRTNVFLPCDAAAQMANPALKPPYKTLYLLTGFADNSDRVVLETNLNRFCEKYSMAIVVVDGNNLFYVDSNPFTRYSAFIGEELVQVTRNAFHLSDKKEDTFIGGMSMGGYGAFYNGLKYSDVFGKIALDAPAFGIYDITAPGTDIPLFPTQFLDCIFGSRERFEKEFDYLPCVENKKPEEIPQIFLGIGKDDIVVIKGVNALRAYAEEKGIGIDFCEVPGGHDFVFMDNIFEPMFAFLAK